jgi:hypothetical protein
MTLSPLVLGLVLQSFRETPIRVVYNHFGQLKPAEGEFSFYWQDLEHTTTSAIKKDWLIVVLSTGKLPAWLHPINTDRAVALKITRDQIISIELLDRPPASSAIKKTLQTFKKAALENNVVALNSSPPALSALSQIFSADAEVKQVETVLLKEIALLT